MTQWRVALKLDAKLIALQKILNFSSVEADD